MTGGRSPTRGTCRIRSRPSTPTAPRSISKPTVSGGRVRPTRCGTNCSTRCTTRRATSSPDVVADFTSARFDDLPGDRVRITGVRGTAATDTYKLLLSAHAGWSGETRVAFSWPDAYEKAKATAAIFVKRVEMARPTRSKNGASSTGVSTRSGGPTVPLPVVDGCEPPECVLRVAWRCADQRTAGLVGREMVPLTLSSPPAGLTGAGRGPGSATELLSIWPTLVDKAVVDSEVRVVLETVRVKLALARALRLPRGRQGRHRQRRDLRRRRRDVRAHRARGHRRTRESSTSVRSCAAASTAMKPPTCAR